MATGVQVWSETPVTNATVDSNINFAEGMAPSQVNDSARALMASVAKWRDDNNTTLITSGTTTALTLATNQVEAGLTAGYTVAATLGTAVDASATLAVDGLTAAPIQLVKGSAISAGQLSSGQTVQFTYSSTGTGQWILTQSAPVIAAAAPNSPVGVAFSPSAAVTYNQTTAKMMGLGGTVSFCPKTTGRLMVHANFNFSASAVTAVRSAIYFGAGGTASAPSSGAAPTGTSVGTGTLNTAFTGDADNLFTQGLITGATVGTSYWVDLSFQNVSASIITSSAAYICIQEF